MSWYLVYQDPVDGDYHTELHDERPVPPLGKPFLMSTVQQDQNGLVTGLKIVEWSDDWFDYSRSVDMVDRKA
jgi:hypothetical protein